MFADEAQCGDACSGSYQTTSPEADNMAQSRLQIDGVLSHLRRGDRWPEQSENCQLHFDGASRYYSYILIRTTSLRTP
jgi:hypothetical protein